MITKIKVWKSSTNECRIYVETDERTAPDGRNRDYPVEGCYYLTGNPWHPAKSWDGTLTDEQKAEARRLSIKDGKWTTWYAPTAPAKPIEKQPDAKELARKAAYEAEEAFIAAHGGVIASTTGREQRGEFILLRNRDHSEQVLIVAGSFYTDDAESEGENAGWYTRLCEPTTEEKQSTEYQRLNALIAQREQDEKEAIARAVANSEDREQWDSVDWDMSLACNAGHHDNCNGKNCTCECHKPSKPEPTSILPTSGPSDVDFTRQFEQDTGIKTLRDDGGRDLGFYDFNDLKIAAGGTHISGACDPDHFNHQCGPCYDNRCQCACHQPVPAGHDFYQHRMEEYQHMRAHVSGSALVVAAPEIHVQMVVASVPVAISRREDGRFEVILNGVSRKQTYAHRSSARRWIRKHPQ